MKSMPYKALLTHGVPKEQVLALERTFGKVFPDCVQGPDTTLAWAFGVLPWDRTGRTLADAVAGAFARCGLQSDARVRRILQALRAPTPKALAELSYQLDELVATIARVKGLDLAQADEDMFEWPDELKAWLAAGAAIAAAKAGLAERNLLQEGESLATEARNTLCWAMAQGDRIDRARLMDRMVTQVIGEVAGFIGTWVPTAIA